MLLPLFDQFSRRRRIYVSMIVSDTLEHSERLAMMYPQCQVIHYSDVICGFVQQLVKTDMKDNI